MKTPSLAGHESPAPPAQPAKLALGHDSPGLVLDVADAVVVGGGVVGASVAFHLAELRVGRVILCERASLAAGATGKSASLVRTHYKNPAEARLASASLPYFAEWDQRVGAGSCGFVRTGYLHLEPATNAASLAADVAMLRDLRINTSVLSTEDVLDLAPYLQLDDQAIGAFEPDSGYAYSVGTTEGFAEGARQLGAEIRLDSAVTDVHVAGGRVVAVSSTTGSIATPRVILAAGVWSLPLLHRLGIRPPLQVARTQVGVFDWPPARDGHRLTIVNDSVNRLYFRPDGPAGDRIIAGLGSGARRELADPDSLDEDVDADYLATARERLMLRMPWATYARPLGGWAGPITLTPDGMPIVDRPPDIEGCFFFVGDSGSSFKTAPALGRGLAEWTVLGAPRAEDFQPFRAGRFTGAVLEQDFARLAAGASSR